MRKKLYDLFLSKMKKKKKRRRRRLEEEEEEKEKKRQQQQFTHTQRTEYSSIL